MVSVLNGYPMYVLGRVCTWDLGFYKLEALGALMDVLNIWSLDYG